jgi:hypothetical protein
MDPVGREGILFLSHVRLFYNVETQKLATTRLPECDNLNTTRFNIYAQNAQRSLAATGLGPRPRCGVHINAPRLLVGWVVEPLSTYFLDQTTSYIEISQS